MLKKVKNEHLSDYLFGYLSLEDQRQVEAALAQDKELAAEFNKIQDALAGFGGAFAKSPSDKVKERIFAEINQDVKEAPAEKKEAKTVSFISWRSFSIAASLAFLLSLGMSMYLNNELTRVKDLVAFLDSDREDLQNNLVSLSKQNENSAAQFQTVSQQLEDVRKFENIKVVMNGSAKMPQAAAEVYWNPSTKDVFIHKCNLPKAPDGHQLQLWAIVDSNPVNMGCFNVTDNQVAIQNMGVMETASAFAVTIEETVEGGKDSPNLDMLVVIGEV